MRRQIFKEVQRRKMKTAVKMALTAAAAAAALAAAVTAAGVFMMMRKKQEDKEKEGEDHPQYWENVGGRWVFWGKKGNKWTEETGWIDADVEIYPEEMRERGAAGAVAGADPGAQVQEMEEMEPQMR